MASLAGFTLSEMQDEVADQLRNTKVRDKITRWLNLTIATLAGKKTWDFLYKSNGFVTQAGVRTYDLFDNYLNMINVSLPDIPRQLYSLDEKFLAEEIPSYLTITGTPTGYFIHNKQISLFRIPDTQYNVSCFFYGYPILLVNPNDVSDFPMEWHPVIIAGAVVRGFRYEGNADQLEEAKEEYNRLYALQDKLSSAGSSTRHTLGSPEYRYTRPVRPSLPSNYPRG